MRCRAVGLVFVVVAGALSGCGGTTTTPSPTPSTAACTPVSSVDGLDLVRPGTLTVGSDIGYPPQEFFNGTKPTGFDLDLANAIAQKLCLTFTPVNSAFDGILPALNQNKFDIVVSGLTISPERARQVTLVPYFSAGEQFVVKKGNLAAPPKALSDLCGLRVAVQSGTAEMTEMLDTVNPQCGPKPATLLRESTDPEALERVKNGQADVEFTDSPVAQYYVKQDPAELMLSGPILETAVEGIAVRTSDTRMVVAVKAAFAAVRADGTYASLLDTWGLSSSAVSG